MARIFLVWEGPKDYWGEGKNYVVGVFYSESPAESFAEWTRSRDYFDSDLEQTWVEGIPIYGSFEQAREDTLKREKVRYGR